MGMTRWRQERGTDWRWLLALLPLAGCTTVYELPPVMPGCHPCRQGVQQPSPTPSSPQFQRQAPTALAPAGMALARSPQPLPGQRSAPQARAAPLPQPRVTVPADQVRYGQATPAPEK